MVPTNPNILVINVARIGDTLLTTPVLRAIKETLPGCRITCLAHPKRVDVLQGLPWIDELGVVTPRRAVWRGRFAHRQRNYDYALVYGHDAPLIHYAARVAQRVVAFTQPEAALNRLLWKCIAIPPVREKLSAVEEHLLLATALGVRTSDHRLAYAPLASELDAARAWLTQHARPGAAPLIGFQVSSFPTKAYRDWPLEYFAELGKLILNVWPEAEIVILGGDESRGKALSLRRQLGAHVLVAAGKLNLRMSAAVMTQLALYVGVDTGPTHLAGALGVPMVALYHCRHRSRRFAPALHPKLRVVEHPRPDNRCDETVPMAEIGVTQVWPAVRELLERAEPVAEA
jgi:heptosyltransferase-3